MRKKLLAIFAAVLMVCSLGMIGLSSASAANLTVNDCSHTDDWHGIVFYVSGSNTSISTEGTNIDSTYITYVDAAGNNKLTDGAFWLDANRLVVRANSPVDGDIVALRAGFTWGADTVASDIVYTVKGANASCVAGGTIPVVTTLKIDDCSHAHAWNAILVKFNANNGNGAGITQFSDNTPSYFTFVSSNGTNKLSKVECIDGDYARIDSNNGFAWGDKLTIKAGLSWGGVTLENDVVYYCNGTNKSLTLDTSSAATGSLGITDVAHDTAWGNILVTFDTSTTLTTGTRYANNANFVTYTDSTGATNKFTEMFVVDETHLAIVASSYTSGDLITLKSGFYWGTGKLAADTTYTCAGTGAKCTLGGTPSGGDSGSSGTTTPDTKILSATHSPKTNDDGSLGFGAIVIEFNGNNGLAEENASTPMSSTYFSYTDANGVNKLSSVVCASGTHAIINSDDFMIGDILTIKAGLTWGTVSITEDIKYTFMGEGAVLTPGVVTISDKGTLTATEYQLFNNDSWGGPSIQFKFSGFTGTDAADMTSMFNFDGKSVDVIYVKASGEAKETAGFICLGNGYFLVKLSASLAQGAAYFSPEVGDIIVIKSGSYIFTGTNKYWVANTSDLAFQVTTVPTYGSTASLSVYTGDTSNLAGVTAIQISGNGTMFVGGTQTLTYTLNEGASATITFSSSVPSVATVDASTGLVTALAAGETVITASALGGSITATFNIEVNEVSADGAFIVEMKWTTYYAPMAFTKLDKTFTLTSQYPDLIYYYAYADGTISAKKPVTEAMLSGIDYTTEGTQTVTITDPKNAENTKTINVQVYMIKEIAVFNTLGVSSYDKNDTRSEAGFWNGNVIIDAKGTSTNVYNCRNGEWDGRDTTRVSDTVVSALWNMACYIDYYVAATGQTFNNSASGDGGQIGAWQLEGSVLILVTPDGSDKPVGYGDASTWNAITDTTHKDYNPTYYPVYKLGDKLIFKKGMPMYKCIVENDVDHMVIEGFLTKDHVWIVTSESLPGDPEGKHLFTYYAESTDFSIEETLEIGKGQNYVLNPIRLPEGSTTGTFAYSSSDTDIATVTTGGTISAIASGTATITITMSGMKDVSGNTLSPISHDVVVTVKKGITNVALKQAVSLNVGDTPDLSTIMLTVTYDDGSTEDIALNNSRVTPTLNISTDAAGTTTYRVKVDDVGPYAVKITVVDSSHVHTFDTANWSSDESYHWHAATCSHTTEMTDYAEHIDDDGDDLCDVCNYDLHVHRFKTEWTSNSTDHWHESRCGHDVYSEVGNHVYTDANDFTCDTCGYCKHSYAGAEWKYNATQHWHDATCGCTDAPSIDVAEHSFDATTHLCECGANNHTWNTKYSKDETHHWVDATCGCTVKELYEEHSFDASTHKCVCGATNHEYNGEWLKNATLHWKHADCHNVDGLIGEHTLVSGVCSVCGYGDSGSGDGSHTHDFGTAWESDANTHWHECSCGEKSDEAAHVNGNDFICDVCGYSSCDHTYDNSVWVSDSTGHWHASTCGCGVKKDQTNHRYATTGNDRHICLDCGYCRHRFPSAWNWDTTGHYKYADCGCTETKNGKEVAVSKSGRHVDENGDNKCDVCGAAPGTTNDGSNGGGGCASLVATAGLLPVTLLGVGVVLVKRKMRKKK